MTDNTPRPRDRLTPAEKVARAAASILDSLGEEVIAEVREAQADVKGCGGVHYITNGRLLALADAVEAWRGVSR